jgi:hypothetical protein
MGQVLAYITDLLWYILRPLIGSAEACEARRRNRSLSLKKLVADRRKPTFTPPALCFNILTAIVSLNFDATHERELG